MLALLTAVPPQCTLVAASMIPTEWKDNAQKVRDEVIGKLKKIQEQASMFHDACSTLGISLTFGRPVYSSIGLIERLATGQPDDVANIGGVADEFRWLVFDIVAE